MEGFRGWEWNGLGGWEWKGLVGSGILRVKLVLGMAGLGGGWEWQG